jgi:thiamine monophosphate synthase
MSAPQLVVISPEVAHPAEALVLQKIAQSPLSCRFHLRRPRLGPLALARELLHFAPELWPWISVHGPLDTEALCAAKGDIAWTHLGQHKRSPDPFEHPKQNGHPQAGKGPLSASLHSLEELSSLDLAHRPVDYAFLSPIFGSLSKPGYRGEWDFGTLTPSLKSWHEAPQAPKILALGGITPQTAAKALELGFTGLAVLGAIWQSQSPNHDPLRALQKMMDCWDA